MNKNGFAVRSSQCCVSSSWSDWSVCRAVNDRCEAVFFSDDLT